MAIGLEAHVRGLLSCHPASSDAELEALIPEDLALLARILPWLGRDRRRSATRGEAMDPEVLDEISDEVEEIAQGLGLDEECTCWLRDLMTEEG
jgi:hypothetical protein